MEVARGVWLALSNGDLGEEWADAIARVEEESPEVHFQLNAARQLSRVKAKHGF